MQSSGPNQCARRVDRVPVSTRLLTTATAISVIADGTDLDEPIFRLPPAYQRVVRWLAEGVAPEEIAARLGIEPQAVPALIELATAKFARAVDEARRREVTE